MYPSSLSFGITKISPSLSLGITQWLIKSGIVSLEEVRASDGTLEDAFVRVSPFHVISYM